MTRIKVILAGLALAIINGLSAAPIITQNLSPRHGSIKGETLIRIIGQNFSPNKNQQNEPNMGNRVVLFDDFVSFDCAVQIDDTSTTQIMCRTPNHMDYTGWLKARVQSDGVWSNTRNWAFQARNDRTPTIWWIRPQVIEPQSLIEHYGNMYTRSYNTTNINWPDSASCPDCAVTKAWIGGRDCDMYDRTQFPMQVHKFYMDGDKDANGNLIEGSEGKNTNRGGFACQLTGTTVGYQNFSYIIDKDYGRSKTSGAVKRLSPSNLQYDVQTYSVVESISTSVTGSNGGGLLKIIGRWFSPTNNKIFIDNQECNDVKVNDDGTELTCRPAAGQPADGDTFYEGNRGFFSQIYDAADESYEDLQNKDPSTSDGNIHASLNGNIHPSQISTFGLGDVSGYVRAFFKPSIDSEYQFDFPASSDAKIYFEGTESTANTIHDLQAGQSYQFEMTHYGSNEVKPSIFQKDTHLSATDHHYAKDHKQIFSASVRSENEIQKLTFNNFPENFDYQELLNAENPDTAAKATACVSCSSEIDNDCQVYFTIMGHPTNLVGFSDSMAMQLDLSGHQERFINLTASQAICDNGQFGVEFFGISEGLLVHGGEAISSNVEYILGTGFEGFLI